MSEHDAQTVLDPTGVDARIRQGTATLEEAVMSRNVWKNCAKDTSDDLTREIARHTLAECETQVLAEAVLRTREWLQTRRDGAVYRLDVIEMLDGADNKTLDVARKVMEGREG